MTESLIYVLVSLVDHSATKVTGPHPIISYNNGHRYKNHFYRDPESPVVPLVLFYLHWCRDRWNRRGGPGRGWMCLTRRLIFASSELSMGCYGRQRLQN